MCVQCRPRNAPTLPLTSGKWTSGTNGRTWAHPSSLTSWAYRSGSKFFSRLSYKLWSVIRSHVLDGGFYFALASTCIASVHASRVYVVGVCVCLRWGHWEALIKYSWRLRNFRAPAIRGEGPSRFSLIMTTVLETAVLSSEWNILPRGGKGV